MADQEVIKHGKKVIKIWSNKNTPFLHKLKDFIVEIFIIVFAISLSLWLHNWSEHSSEQKEVKVFLTGLRDDLKADIKDTKDDLQDYDTYTKVYTFLSRMSPDKEPDKDTLHLAVKKTIHSNSFLIPHKTRFNGFLSAGKIMNIEDDSLTMDILNYYQETLLNLQSSEGGWMSRSAALQNYMDNNLTDFDNDMEAWKLLSTSKGRYLTAGLIPWPQLMDRYQKVMNDAQKIIDKINKMYPEKG